MQAQLQPPGQGELRFAVAESQNPILSRAVSECVQVCCQAAFPLPPHCRDAANCAFQMSCRFPPAANFQGASGGACQHRLAAWQTYLTMALTTCAAVMQTLRAGLGPGVQPHLVQLLVGF